MADLPRQLGRRVARTPLARLATLPLRTQQAASHSARQLTLSARWLLTSREHTNFTYDLKPLNTEHLAWFVAQATRRPVQEIRGYCEEVQRDEELRRHLTEAARRSPRRHLTDPELRPGRRIGWYALVRALRPEHVVETGTDKGLGAVLLGAAVLRNGSGRVTTIDTNPDAGTLIGGRYADVVTRRTGDSVRELGGVGPVDFFLHDSLHTADHERAELAAVAPHLTERAVALSDNAHMTRVLPAWAEETGRQFLFFDERPERHWYPGEGIGLAWRP
ncbi:class I SAM-dependent methyltransferase [Streptomyces sp. NPDC001941]|uniref:class I SAM-dependent methyltransferase n=1 Tax=Streptomyces sp. NPDC001941 TaxID=3154659 RepID=UPI003318537F